MATGNAIVAANVAVPPAVPEADLAAAVGYARAEKAAATRKAYGSDFAIFWKWCEERGLNALPATPESVAAFLATEAGAGIKPSTIGRRVAAIQHAHKLAGHEPSTASEAVRATVRGIRRSVGVAPIRKAAATADKVRAMVLMTPETLGGLRDHALLLLGFAGAFRRSELVALNVADIEECDGGMRVRVFAARRPTKKAKASLWALCPAR